MNEKAERINGYSMIGVSPMVVTHHWANYPRCMVKTCNVSVLRICCSLLGREMMMTTAQVGESLRTVPS